jgi:hypothetical protein
MTQSTIKLAIWNKVAEYTRNNQGIKPNVLLISDDIKMMILLDNSDLMLLGEFTRNRKYMGMDVFVCFDYNVKDYLEVSKI